MSEQTNPIISFKNFSFQYRAQKKPTLHDINLDIYPGERVLIAGPSGSGKSTLAACINGLNPFSYPGECTGSLTVDGVDAPNSSIFELSAHVGTVLQDPDGQFIGLTVGEDIAFALENSCVPQKEMHEITRHAAELVGIENRLDHAPHELSGGQKQRVSLAGVMVDQVKILMFDEPLASLDPATGKQAIELIDEIQHKTDTTVLIIEHRLEDVLWRNVDRIILVNEGTILADLRPDELLATHMLAENGIREPGLAFVTRACDYYHVSADYLLGRTLSRDGSIIEAGDVYDSSGEKGSLRGSIMATLQKKLVVNTAGVLFDQLGKTGSREAVTAAGDYLSGALYSLLRQLYRRGGGNEDFFAVSPGDYDGGLVQADMTMSQVRYRRALSQAEEVQEITPDTLTAGYPGLGQSVAQVIHNTDERCKSLQ